MSKGLGALQKEILNTLSLAKEETVYYPGSARIENFGYTSWKWDKPGWVFCRGCRVRVADHIYDLRASMRYLALRYGKTYFRDNYVASSFQAAFSRAVKGLLKRGHLLRLDLVPIIDYDGKFDLHFGGSRVMMLRDGMYLMAWPRQVRFVSVKYICRNY